MNEKITAWALGELPEAEHAALEAELMANPALQAEAEALRDFCRTVEEHCPRGPALTSEQRTAVREAFRTAGTPAPGKVTRIRWSRVAAWTAAACVTGGLMLWQGVGIPASSPSTMHAEAPAQPRLYAERGIYLKPTLPATTPAPPPPGSQGRARLTPVSSASGPAGGELDERMSARPANAANWTWDYSVATTETSQGQTREIPVIAATQAAAHMADASLERTLATNADLTPRPGTPVTAPAPTEARFQFEPSPASAAPGTETYAPIFENPFLYSAQVPLSTLSIDVDTASYANVRRFLNMGTRPPADAVRLEELINYFPYSYADPVDGKPFAVQVDVAEAPWQPLHRLARVALKARDLKQERQAANFIFLVDISGSMDEPAKLPLVKQSLQMLTEQLRGSDHVGIVTYAGETGVALPSTSLEQKETILSRISAMRPGGSTNGAGGIQLAYQEARTHFKPGGVNRVILCTDGDFNVGISSPEELEKLITAEAKSGVFLSVLGYGTGNLQDRTMETLADKGNGNYAYIDSLSEARKVLVDQMTGTLVTVAKDVKIQIEFNPAKVAAYRLLGYENRVLPKEAFNDDTKDAGEIGAGHTVTALYEIVPAALKHPNGLAGVDPLKYSQPVGTVPPATDPVPASAELMTVKLRWKQPQADKSEAMEVPVTDAERKIADGPRDFQFAASVAGFGMMLRNSAHRGTLTWDMVRSLALSGKGDDPQGYRGEFLQLIDKARGLTGN